MGCILSSDSKSQLTNTSAPVKKTPSTEVRAFKVTVQKPAGEKLGVELGTLDGKALLVLSVKPGLVMELNKTHPETPISAGDFILGVNGIRDNVEAMKADLGGKETLELIVAPFAMVLKKNPEQSEEQASSTTDVTVKIQNEKAVELGVQLASHDGSTLQVVGLFDGFVKSHNDMAPEAAVCVGDTIVALHANDTAVQGDARELLVAIAKLGSGVLTLRRKAAEPLEVQTKAEPVADQKPQEDEQKEPEAAPVEEQTVDKREAEETEVKPIQQPEEDKASDEPPAVILDGAQVRRGGFFCCAPRVDAAAEGP